jgi:acyl carrier protein
MQQPRPTFRTMTPRLLVAAGRWEAAPQWSRAAIWRRLCQQACDDVVRDTIGWYLGVHRDQIEESQRLSEDLGLDALDLAFVAGTLARSADRAFPLHRLDGVETVADLARVVSAWAEGEVHSVNT